jgi:hypothetical protein
MRTESVPKAVPRPARFHALATPGRAAVALALCLATLAHAEEITMGRVFFTPERRQQLDHQRRFNLSERREIPADAKWAINGVVTRSQGKQTVWINGVPRDSRETDPDGQGLTVTPDHAHPGKVIVQPDSGPTADAAVGDTLHRTWGESTRLLQGGRIVIHRPESPR